MLNSVAGPGARGVGLLSKDVAMTSRGLIVSMLLFLSCGCSSSFTYSRLASATYMDPLYALTYYKDDPVAVRKPDEWRCIRFYSDCFGFSPDAAEFSWLPSGKVRIESMFMNSSEYFASLDNDGYQRGLCRKVQVRRIVVITDNAVIKKALETVWHQLATYNYYEELALDGCAISIEVFGHSGVKRRIVFSSPMEPQFGSDVTVLLSETIGWAQQKTMSPKEHRRYFTQEIDESGTPVTNTIEGTLKRITLRTDMAICNEEQVAAYKKPPCASMDRLLGKDISQPESTALDGCFIIEQPLGMTEYIR
jgi:hypothetical protein